MLSFKSFFSPETYGLQMVAYARLQGAQNNNITYKVLRVVSRYLTLNIKVSCFAFMSKKQIEKIEHIYIFIYLIIS